jgi:heat shock factor-binding protein 1
MSSENPPPGENQPSNGVQEMQNSQDAVQVSMMLQTLLESMSTKFEMMSQQILGKIDEMGQRIDDLEVQMQQKMKSVNKLEQQPSNGSNGSS